MYLILRDCPLYGHFIALSSVSQSLKIPLNVNLNKNGEALLIVHPRCINYRIFKINFGLENYLLNLPKDLKVTLTKLRTCNHHLPIEKGRWHNIDRNLRIYTCDCKTIGDEFHYVMECKYFSNDRKIIL